ncbi:psbp domain-containing protein 6, chloroplastic [Fagus crenata]
MANNIGFSNTLVTLVMTNSAMTILSQPCRSPLPCKLLTGHSHVFHLARATNSATIIDAFGNVQPYQFILPPTWKQLRIANILSGNYCQPKCAEPWVEVKFEDEKQEKVQVVASPLIRLTNKPNSSIEEIGSPEKLIASLGPFVTGDTYDPDELLETSVEKRGDQTVQFFSLYCLPYDLLS